VGANVVFSFFADKPGDGVGGGGWDSFFRLVVEFGFRSRLEVVLDGKGEGPAKKGEIEEEGKAKMKTKTMTRTMLKSKTVGRQITPMDHDNRIVPSVQTNSDLSLPMITVFPSFHHLNSNYRWQFARPSTSTSHISSRYPEILVQLLE
jgi:hypothetical protein